MARIVTEMEKKGKRESREVRWRRLKRRGKR
jgi:hypothetical protein